MLYSRTDPESYITEYTLVHEDNISIRATGGHALARRVRFDTHTAYRLW